MGHEQANVQEAPTSEEPPSSHVCPTCGRPLREAKERVPTRKMVSLRVPERVREVHAAPLPSGPAERRRRRRLLPQASADASQAETEGLVHLIASVPAPAQAAPVQGGAPGGDAPLPALPPPALPTQEVPAAPRPGRLSLALLALAMLLSSIMWYLLHTRTRFAAALPPKVSPPSLMPSPTREVPPLPESDARAAAPEIDPGVAAHSPREASARRSFAELAQLGQRLIDEGRVAEAEQVYEAMRAARPDHPVVYYGLGTCQAETGRSQKAIELFERALALRPDYSPALIGLAKARKQRGEHAEALALLRRYLEKHPDGSRTAWVKKQVASLERRTGTPSSIP